jgi:hypothetical protein
MKLEQTTKGFKEVIKAFDCYESEVMFDQDSIPKGCVLSVKACDDHLQVCVYRFHPFNEKVVAARRDQVAYSNLRGDSFPTVKFYIKDWTPEKLAEMQAKVAQRVVKYNDLTVKYVEATKAYNAALEAQRREITGEST